jgi:hypothetical protein
MLPYTFPGRVVRIYTTLPIRINCAGRRRKYAVKDIEARYYDANERPERPGGAPSGRAGVQRMLKTLSRDERLERVGARTCRYSALNESAPNRSTSGECKNRCAEALADRKLYRISSLRVHPQHGRASGLSLYFRSAFRRS